MKFSIYVNSRIAKLKPFLENAIPYPDITGIFAIWIIILNNKIKHKMLNK